jgi:hypothetical protein
MIYQNQFFGSGSELLLLLKSLLGIMLKISPFLYDFRLILHLEKDKLLER